MEKWHIHSRAFKLYSKHKNEWKNELHLEIADNIYSIKNLQFDIF